MRLHEVVLQHWSKGKQGWLRLHTPIGVQPATNLQPDRQPQSTTYEPFDKTKNFGMGRKMNLDDLKALDFATVATLFGYETDRSESNARNRVLRRGFDNDKLLLRLEGCKWLYCSCRNPNDNGSLLDFVMKRLGIGLHAAAEWLATTPLPSHTETLAPEPQPDRERLQRIWHSCVAATHNPWLTQRGIPTAVQADDRFRGCFRTGRNNEVVFPYHDDAGLCGLEVRAPGVKRFVAGSRRGMWSSRNLGTATVLIVEAPTDAMAHFTLYGGNQAYVAIGGALTPRQVVLLTSLLSESRRRVIAGFDNDDAGNGYTELLHQSLIVERLVPVGKDWCSDLEFITREET